MIIRKFGWTLAALTASSGVWCQTYTVIDLTTIPNETSIHGTDINNLGHVVGYADISGQALMWNLAGQQFTLAGPGGFRYQEATGINDLDEISGTTVNPTGARAARWVSGAHEYVGVPPTNSSSNAYRINSAGQIVGKSGAHAFLWSSANGMLDLGALPGDAISAARSISDTGIIVGDSPGGRSFRWTAATGMNELFPPGSEDNVRAKAVSNDGYIAGTADVNLQGNFRPVIWNPAGTPLFLGGPGQLGMALAINNSNMAVGWLDGHAFRWTAGEGLVDLNTLISPSSGLTLVEATAVNDLGQIVVRTRTGQGEYHLMVLNPVPEPCSLIVVGAGVAGLLRRRRRSRTAPPGL